MSKKRRIMVLMHEDLVPPATLDGCTDEQIASWKTEYDVVTGLELLGHEVKPLGVYADLTPIRDALEEFKPHITFNLLEEFHGVATYDNYVVSFLELMRKPYTGCNPRGLMLAHDKALSKKILTYHRIPTPLFMVFPMGRRMGRRPKRLGFPLLVKSLTEEGSVGIAQASVVTSDQKLQERVEFIHRQIGTDAIAEQYIDGREFYVGVMGNQRLQTLPIWELTLNKMPEDSRRIATSKVKWDQKYQQRVGVETGEAKLPENIAERVRRVCKRAYRVLGLTGYARMDLRVTEEGQVYLIEANPNPQLAYGEDFAESAHHAGMDYESLLQRIITLGLGYRAQWRQ